MKFLELTIDRGRGSTVTIALDDISSVETCSSFSYSTQYRVIMKTGKQYPIEFTSYEKLKKELFKRE